MRRGSSFIAMVLVLAIGAPGARADDGIERLPATDVEPESVAPAEVPSPSDKTGEPAAADDAPLAFYEPGYWFGTGWDGDLSMGVNGSEGNAQSFSFRVAGNLKRETKQSIVTGDFTHAKTVANSAETQNNALANLKYEYKLGDSRWSLFLKGFLEYDEFKAFDLRLTEHAGVAYKFLDGDVTTLKGRFGSGTSQEIGGPDDAIVPEAEFGADLEHKISDKQKVVVKFDFYPEWGEFENYRAITDASWQCILDEATNLSLKIGAIDRYDSTPHGRRPNDIDYAMLLLWKF